MYIKKSSNRLVASDYYLKKSKLFKTISFPIRSRDLRKGKREKTNTLYTLISGMIHLYDLYFSTKNVFEQRTATVNGSYKNSYARV